MTRWKAVPAVLTPEMWAAGARTKGLEVSYEAMLAAAPAFEPVTERDIDEVLNARAAGYDIRYALEQDRRRVAERQAPEIERLRAEVAAHRKHDVLRCDALMKAEAELASLRQKARLWDAVRSGKVRIDYNLDDTYGAFYGPIGKGKRTLTLDTAEEAVEAAIAAGALK